jgi:predicted neutral ceramidase superfamily lipid hydrolase
MKMTFALLRLAVCLFVLGLPFAAINAELMVSVLAMALVCTVMLAFIVAFFEAAMLLAGPSAARPPKP